MLLVCFIEDGIMKHIEKRSDVTFKNGSFSDSVSEKVCENMIYCGCHFSRNSSWFVYFWNHSVSIDYIEKSLHFLFVSWSSSFRLKSTAIWNNLFDFILENMLFKKFSNGSISPLGGL